MTLGNVIDKLLSSAICAGMVFASLGFTPVTIAYGVVAMGITVGSLVNDIICYHTGNNDADNNHITDIADNNQNDDNNDIIDLAGNNDSDL